MKLSADQIQTKEVLDWQGVHLLNFSQSSCSQKVRILLSEKGLTVGMCRAEYEYSIPIADAKDMLELCEGPLIEKNRWLVPAGNLTWEIDEFMGENQGLVVAEIEIEDEGQSFEMPSWIGKEVTDDARYYNSSLSIMPFKRWG